MKVYFLKNTNPKSKYCGRECYVHMNKLPPNCDCVVYVYYNDGKCIYTNIKNFKVTRKIEENSYVLYHGTKCRVSNILYCKFIRIRTGDGKGHLTKLVSPFEVVPEKSCIRVI